MSKGIFYHHRQLEKLLMRAARQFPALLVTGPRQSGKSTLLQHLFGRTHRYLSLDDPLLRQEALNDPKGFLSTHGDHLILDEIQYVPELFSYLKGMIDSQREQKGRFLLTGSQYFPLMKGVSESLAGRIALFELLPLSFHELYSSSRAKQKSSVEYFTSACLTGSFPELVFQHDLDRGVWYRSYLQTYLERDVRGLHNIGNLTAFHQCMGLLAAQAGHILNMSALASDLGLSVGTIRNWLSVLEASRIIFLLPPYSRSHHKRIRKSPKIYFLDIGFLCFLLQIDKRESILRGPFKGALFENWCVQETVKALLEQGNMPNLSYLRTSHDMEIDLLIERQSALYPLECKATITPKLDMAKSLATFPKLFSSWNIKKGKLLTLSDEHRSIARYVDLITISSYLPWLKKLMNG